jgi:hypothetical protein
LTRQNAKPLRQPVGKGMFLGYRPFAAEPDPKYARLVSQWIGSVGPDPRLFGTHSLRRTKATLIYRRTGSLRGRQRTLRSCVVKSGMCDEQTWLVDPADKDEHKSDPLRWLQLS